MVNELHKIFNDLERFTYPFENRLNEIPNNGIYVKFEKGEKIKRIPDGKLKEFKTFMYKQIFPKSN